MRNGAMVLVGIGLGCAAGGAAAAEPYEGLWGATAAACRDPDGADRMEITGHRFFWYETRCTAQPPVVAGPRFWTLRMTCEGEGRRFTVRPGIRLPHPNQLVMENGPVGRDPKRQTWTRCPMP